MYMKQEENDMKYQRYIYECVKKLSMIISLLLSKGCICNIGMICLELNWFFVYLSHVLEEFSGFCNV